MSGYPGCRNQCCCGQGLVKVAAAMRDASPVRGAWDLVAVRRRRTRSPYNVGRRAIRLKYGNPTGGQVKIILWFATGSANSETARRADSNVQLFGRSRSLHMQAEACKTADW